MTHFNSGITGAVNHLRATVNAWYHPYISRGEGAQLLEGCEAGSFILRESSKAGSYALSVVLPNLASLGHYLVEKRGPDCFCLQGSENSFISVEELLAHYHHNDSIGLPCRLRLPQRHSSSMSHPARPSQPALPPRNSRTPSASFSGSRHSLKAKAQQSWSYGPSSPHPSPAYSPFLVHSPLLSCSPPSHNPSSCIASPHSSAPQALHSPLPSHSPTRSPSPVPHHPHPFPQRTSPAATPVSQSPGSALPYEDMSPRVPCSRSSSLIVNPATSRSAVSSTSSPLASRRDDLFGGGETYEDMGHNASSSRGRATSTTAVCTPTVTLSTSHSLHDMLDELSETYEDMTVTPKLHSNLGHAVSSPISSPRSSPSPSMVHRPVEDEGETYEDMGHGLSKKVGNVGHSASCGSTPQVATVQQAISAAGAAASSVILSNGAPRQVPMLPDEGEMYEYMASVPR